MKKTLLWILALSGLFLAIVIAILMPAFGGHPEMRNQIQCGSQLNEIGKACYMYMRDNDGKMPPNFKVLFETEKLDRKLLVCPSSGDDAGECSYTYRGADLNEESSSALVVAYDKKDNHSGDPGVRNVLFADSHVRKYMEKGFQELMVKDNEIRQKVGLMEKPVE